MNNSTTLPSDITSYFYGYSNQDIELANLIQSGLSLICTLVILLKITNPLSIFKSVRERQRVNKQNKQRRELKRLEELIKQVNQGQNANIDELLSDDEESEKTNELPIARKKKQHSETKV